MKFFKKYRPVSNLPFISKIIEKYVDSQITEHDKKHDLSEHLQLANTSVSSTETALLSVQNNLLMAIPEATKTHAQAGLEIK